MADRFDTNRFDTARWPGRDEIVRVAGRPFGIRHYGDTAGLPCVMLHGTPGSRIMFAGTDALARQRGIHVIALDRWNYGETAAPARPTLVGFADDVADIMDQLGIKRFAIAGVSGGGPYTAAIAAHHAARVTAAALISPVGLVREATAHREVDAFHRFCFHVLPRSQRSIAAIFAAYRAAVRASAGLACGVTTARAPKADKAIMADCATSDRLMAAFHEGLRRSTRGPAIDLDLFREIDALDLTRATVPAHVWIGTVDGNVPVAAAKRLAAAMPNAELTVLEGAGHLWVAHNYDVILDWVRARATVTPDFAAHA